MNYSQNVNTYIRYFLFYLSFIKSYHWNTSVYENHIASDTLHTNLQKLVDRFIEVFIGETGRRNIMFKNNSYESEVNDEIMLDTTVGFKDWLRVLKLPNVLGNIRDEMIAEINIFLYLSKMAKS